ncbi:MAG: N-6 DNA methylase [Chitinispirillales bacterium]|jgi:predicted helicase|nr:N-6 DNA methylase [Chitinispirillales bacterium]
MPTTEIAQYITEASRIYQTGNATEHTYRPALQNLLDGIAAAQNLSQLKNLRFTNEPKRIACGAPDFIVTRNDIPVGYIEAKDVGIDLNGKAHKTQFDRYKQSLNNIIFTDYLEFHRYMKGELAESVRIADIKSGKITPIKENFACFEQLICNFGLTYAQGIDSPAEIAGMMAAKARLMAEVIEKSVNDAKENSDDDNALFEQMASFQAALIPDIKPNEFADVYAQTIAYGLFAARLHDDSPDTFCQETAAGLIPKTNPFLRQFFQQIAGFNLDDSIGWLVKDLARAIQAANLTETKRRFGESAGQDPLIHFYEDFLSAYAPALRKSRGVWYTPQPVVSFIVGAVDEILEKEFKLPNGLANTSKTKIKVIDAAVQNMPGKEKASEKEMTKEIETHRVQILDPAAGTGTFLAETVNQIHGKYKNQPGVWQSYMKNELIPRLNGFEILMAPYTIAHTKLELLLAQTGYVAADSQWLHIYLTNSLEDTVPEGGAPILVHEARGANKIKRRAPVMVVMGNPPYSGESQNRGEWIARLMEDYKKEPPADSSLQKNNPDHWLEVHEQGAQYLQERNSKWINDDYCKFIRLGQYFVDKNNAGILAYINNHGFIDNPTFRGMRWSLLKSFDKIYILDLHGNARKKEVCPDGSKDENVFDIQQGVSINIFVKTGKKKYGELAEVYHLDLYGKRKEKYDYLSKNKFSKVPFIKLEPSAPEYFFVPKDYGLKEEYDSGFGVQELFPVNSVGVVTANDSVFVNADKKVLSKNIKDNFDVTPDKKLIQRINYRPFDSQYVYYDVEKIERAREKVMSHFLNGENIGLVVARQCASGWRYVFITENIADLNLTGTAGSFGSGYVFPLYLYPGAGQYVAGTREPNLDRAIISEIERRTRLRFTNEEKNASKTFAPIDILDYIYAVLHSPAYREKYREFLKIDFPRVPYPEDAKQFRRLAKIGGKLRSLHLLEDVEPKKGIAEYIMPGNDTVERVRYESGAGQGNIGRVWINDKQYFDNVPTEAWNFYIGGYQPAQKWLKDRKGRTLEFEDMRHYQKLIHVLVETARIMGELGEKC